MSSSFVSFFSGGYLYAIAHFGVLYVVPKISLKCKLSTFTTAPSIPNDSFSLSSPIFLIASIASSIVLHSFLTGTTLILGFLVYLILQNANFLSKMYLHHIFVH